VVKEEMSDTIIMQILHVILQNIPARLVWEPVAEIYKGLLLHSCSGDLQGITLTCSANL